MIYKDRPPITVVIATRDREDKVIDAVNSVVQNNYPDFSIIVVDQSRQYNSANSFADHNFINKIEYIRSTTTGLSRAKNIGIEHAKSELIAITDDDCTVPVNWLNNIAQAFSKSDRIGIVFGNVLPGHHDHTKGFIPIHIRKQDLMAENIYDKPDIEGISACMALKRSLWEKSYGFDNLLGAGSRFNSAEESDLTIKALMHGYSVYETPSVSVTHHGYRNWDDAYRLIEDYWYGTGAMYSKYIKCGYFAIIVVLVKLAYKWAFGESLTIQGMGTGQHRFRRLLSFCRGFCSGLLVPVDRKKQLFIESQ